MKEGRRSDSGGFAHHDMSYRSKSDSHRFRLDDQFDKRLGYGIGLIVILGLGLPFGAWIFGYSPYFHSFVHGDKICPFYEKQPSTGCSGDPFTMIWDTTCVGCNNNLPDYNVFSGSNGGKVVFRANCVFTTPCIDMGSDTLLTSIALSNVTIGDLSVVSAKALFSGLVWRTTTATLGNNIQYGFYLTTNKTIPTHDIGSSSAYNPRDDPSVFLTQEFHCSGSCTLAPDTINSDLSFLRTIGQQDSIVKEDHGCPSGSPFMCGSTSVDPTQAGGVLHQFFLNFTGGVNNSPCGVSTGAGCSFLDLNGAQVKSSNTIPWFTFQSQQYYIGFYVMPNLGAEVYFTFDTGNGANQIQYYINAPQTTVSPQIDTGGYFGPIIKGLISIAVFMAQNILNFLNFLVGFFSPILAGMITIIGGVVTFVFNAIGGVFGDGSLGSQIVGFVSNISSYLSNVFSSGISWLGSAITFLSNSITVLTAFFAGGNAFIGLWTNFLGGLATLVSGLNGFFAVLLFYYNLGVFGFNIIFIILIAMLCLAGVTDWIKTDNPLAGFITITLAFFLLYIMQINNSAFNVISGNAQVLNSYQTAWTETKFFVQLLPVIFFGMLVEWAIKLDETHMIHSSTGGFMPNFQSLLRFYIMLTVDIFHGGYWFFSQAYDIISKTITALKGRWSPVEVAGTG